VLTSVKGLTSVAFETSPLIDLGGLPLPCLLSALPTVTALEPLSCAVAVVGLRLPLFLVFPSSFSSSSCPSFETALFPEALFCVFTFGPLSLSSGSSFEADCFLESSSTSSGFCG
jgi:hypothetical protein